MIAYEDMEFERSIFEENYHIAVPMVITQNGDGSLDFLIYSFCREIAEAFEARFAADPFSREAKEYLCEKLTPIMAEMGYETSDAVSRLHLTYRLTDGAAINPECFRGRAKRLDSLTEEDKEGSETEIFAFEINETDELDRIFAIYGTAGEIAAFAAINDIAEDKGFYELNVECAEDYRGRGYGSECVAELAKYLLDRGVPVEYICDVDNIASVMTAKKVGFDLWKRTMPFVCYRIDEEEDIPEVGIPF